MVKAFSVDDLLAILRSTLLHPVVSLLLPCGLVLSGLERSPILLGYNWSSTKWIGSTSPRLTWAMRCVAAAWILSINRALSRRALNPSRKSKPDFKHEIVVVTGGATGIGAVLTQKLEAAGATVIVLDVSPLSYATGSRVSHIKCDVSDASQVQEAAAQVIRLHGSPTMLVANAGIVHGRTIFNATDEDLRLTFGVNVFGLLWAVRTFLPGMIKAGRGHVLVTSSATAFVTVAHMADYSASKAAVTSLVEGLQTELKHQHGNPGVAVSALYPGTIATKMFSKLDSPDSFFLPVLEAGDVAQRMFDILASGQRQARFSNFRILGIELLLTCVFSYSQLAFMPAASNVQPWVRVLPTWMRVIMQDLGSHMADGMGKKQ